MSVLSPTRDLFALAAELDKKSKALTNNYSPSAAYYSGSKSTAFTNYDSRRYNSSQRTPLR